jgi:hypothetical protein
VLGEILHKISTQGGIGWSLLRLLLIVIFAEFLALAIGLIIHYDEQRIGEFASSFFRPAVVLWLIGEVIRIFTQKKKL